MDRFDPFVKYADVYGDIINWEKDPMNKPQNQNKYFFSDGKTYYEQICKMLRLMSVFKEAFNQIYSNEDEISEAWENFVNNLSASVVEGSEPDVTLTWTDDSVNFEFTMVPGVPGEQGVGITSISFNSDYTMTITLSDGNTYTSMSLKGETGQQGPQGETGSGLQILDVYATLADLQSAHPTGQPGDAYQVGSAGNYTLYIWSSSQSAWVPAGSLGTVSPSLSNPIMDGTASAGSQNLYSRGDHVHPTDTSRASKEELDALIKTSQSLIDQSFTYRESPAIQDGLARIDKIKGNTLKWNQICCKERYFTRGAGEWQTYIENGVTFTYLDDYTVRITGTPTGRAYIYLNRLDNANYPVKPGDKLLLRCSDVPNGIDVFSSFYYDNTWKGAGPQKSNKYVTVPSDVNKLVCMGLDVQASLIGQPLDVTVRVNLFNLTQMFGSGNEPTEEEFNALFSSYYKYDNGKLLSFTGTEVKTVGFNQWNEEWEAGILNNDGSTSSSSNRIITSYVPLLPNITYSMTIPYNGRGRGAFYDANKHLIEYFSDFPVSGRNDVFPRDGLISSAGNNYYFSFIPPVCININDSSKNGTYEPYTSSTLSMPISTYFPNGMKSAGSAYDELTENKAVNRINAVDLGSLTWTYEPAIPRFYSTDINNLIKKPENNNTEANAVSAMYENTSFDKLYAAEKKNMTMAFGTTGTFNVINTSYSDANAFKNAMNGVFIYFELDTPVETSVDLDLDFMAYEDGTEQLLPVNGSAPVTSPIIADMTYLSIDDAMEYIIDKLANVPQNTQQILESLEDDISDLQADTGALQTAVSGLQTSVGNINTNIGQLSSTVAGNTSSISDIQSDISDLNTGLNNLNTGLNDLEDTVTNNTSRIGTLETGLTNTDSQVDAIDARVLNLETDLLIIVKKEYDYDSVAGNTNFGVQTGLSQEPGYKIIGIVGSEVQQGEYTSAEPWIIVTQAHVHYTSTGGVVLSMMARNVSEYTKTNVRVYLYLLCIKDTQSQ